MEQNWLFSHADLSDYLDSKESDIFSEIESQEDDYILGVDTQDFVIFLKNKYCLITPMLNENEIFVDKE